MDLYWLVTKKSQLPYFSVLCTVLHRAICLTTLYIIQHFLPLLLFYASCAICWIRLHHNMCPHLSTLPSTFALSELSSTLINPSQHLQLILCILSTLIFQSMFLFFSKSMFVYHALWYYVPEIIFSKCLISDYVIFLYNIYDFLL